MKSIYRTANVFYKGLNPCSIVSFHILFIFNWIALPYQPVYIPPTTWMTKEGLLSLAGLQLTQIHKITFIWLTNRRTINKRMKSSKSLQRDYLIGKYYLCCSAKPSRSSVSAKAGMEAAKLIFIRAQKGRAVNVSLWSSSCL